MNLEEAKKRASAYIDDKVDSLIFSAPELIGMHQAELHSRISELLEEIYDNNELLMAARRLAEDMNANPNVVMPTKLLADIHNVCQIATGESLIKFPRTALDEEDDERR